MLLTNSMARMPALCPSAAGCAAASLPAQPAAVGASEHTFPEENPSNHALNAVKLSSALAFMAITMSGGADFQSQTTLLTSTTSFHCMPNVICALTWHHSNF